MPPKRKARTSPATTEPPKRTRLTATKSPAPAAPAPPPPAPSSDRDTISLATSPAPTPAAQRPARAIKPPSAARPATRTRKPPQPAPTAPPPPRTGADIFDVPSSSSSDELARPAVTPVRRRKKPVVTYKTPTARATYDDDHADDVTPTTRKPAVDDITPRTAARPKVPPRTARKKGTSTAPRTRMQGKMGIGVPAGGEAPTPTAKRGAEVPIPREEEVIHVEVPPASMVRKKRPSAGRPSFGTEGLEDPFAVPKDVVPAAGEDVVVTPTRPKKESAVEKVVKVESIPEEEGEFTQAAVEAVQSYVLAKVMGRKRLNLVGVDEEYANVHQLLEQTVTAGEGNSMLIIGARGSGKTTLVETALASLTESHQGEFHTVRLNGLLQTDDKLALREIWRKLGVEMELDDPDQSKPTNFADTLQSILAVLSHPDELQNEEEGEGVEDPARTATAVIFILDSFDQFATHPRQTLLYNLFDIAQAKKAPIAVIGLTSKVDVVDSLEKRVKSRFSHRTVHLKLPASLDAFWEVVKEGLSADIGQAALQGPDAEAYASAWNSHLDKLRETKEFTSLLRNVYATSKTPAPIFNAAILPLSTLSPSTPFPPATSFTRALAPPASNLALIASLSDLQLALLIAAARLEVLADTETVNFEMVYDEYVKLCAKTRVQATPSGGGIGRVWSKAVAAGAWEGLEKVALVVGAGRQGLWRVDVGLMEIRESVKGTAWVRWCREVV